MKNKTIRKIMNYLLFMIAVPIVNIEWFFNDKSIKETTKEIYNHTIGKCEEW